MLTILIGRAKSGKSERVLREILRLGDSSRQILLVPEHASHAAEMDLCRVCGDTASRHAEVLSFSRLATRVLQRTGGAADVTLDNGGKLLTLERALSETAPMLKLYRRPSQKVAFLQELMALFDELRSYEITPELLDREAREISGATGEKLRDLSLLYGAYDARLHRPGADARDRMSKLCEHLEASHYIDGTDLFLDGFTYFNGQELRALAIFLRRAKSVTVTLLGEKNSRREIFESSLRTRDALVRLAQENGCRSEIMWMASENETPLGHLERCFFGENRPWPGASADGIRVRQAQTAFSEAEQTAADIRRLVASGQCRYRDITVAARNMEDYEDVLEDVFERYEIPAYLSRRSDILQTPALSLITGALEAVIGGFEYAEMFRYLKTGLAGLAPEECDALEDYVLTWEIHGAMWLQEAPWTANPDGYGAPWDGRRQAALGKVNALRERVRIPLKQLTDEIKAAQNAKGKVEALYAFLERLQLQKALEEKMRVLAQAGRQQSAEETAQLWDILCTVLDQFVEILGDEVMNTESFVRLFRLVLTQYSVGTIPVSLDQVTVNEITRNDRHTVRYLFLLGANDHVMPSAGTGGGILNDDDRDELVSRGLRLAPAGMEQLSIEMQNLYAALAQPTVGLTVSYPVTDVAGAELRPAFIIERLLALFLTLRLEREEAGRPYRLVAARPALEAAGEAPGSALWRYFAQREPERIAVMGRGMQTRRGRLSPSAVRALYGEQFSMSASRVEKLNSCHFAYFMQYGLQARRRQNAAFDAPQIGTFLHFVLERVTRKAMERGGFREMSHEELQRLTDQAMDDYAAREMQNFRERSARFRYLFHRLRPAACAVVEEMAEELRHSDFVPLAFELSFGEKGALPAVRVPQESALRVTGKVDRVDGWVKDGRLYVRVVDYKTGKRNFDLAQVRMGLDIQMLLYLFALKEEGAAYFGREIEPAGVLYLPARDQLVSAERNISPEKLQELKSKALRRSGLLLENLQVLKAMEHEALTRPQYLPVRVDREGNVSGSLATAAQLGKLGKYVEETLGEIAREVRNGNIDADPCCHDEDDSVCRFCDWAPACHFEDGRGGDYLRYITPVTPVEFWRQLDGEGGKEDG